MKSSGMTMPRSGWCQRAKDLEADQPAIAERDKRLVVRLDLVGGNGAAQICLLRDPRLQFEIHTRLEEAEPAMPFAFGAIHGDVGRAQQPFGIGPVDRAVGDAYARRRPRINRRRR
jgi:hypothetical protein